jgi:hypothetical protein
MVDPVRTLYVAAGLQSSGSTLLSWCFLQRQDMNGYLDANNDRLADIPADVGAPFVWYKTTICCFRLSDIVSHYQDMGWQVRPLLLIRDVRFVWDSLVRKPYGRNGTTAEDPPLRVRLRRFKDDWEHFRRMRWPIVRFESLLIEPENTLRETCRSLGLPWDPGMMTWAKDPAHIADTRHGNETFRASRGSSLLATVMAQPKVLNHTLADDLKWLETEFEEFNIANHYPLSLPSTIAAQRATQRAIPRYSVTRDCERESLRRPLPWLRRKFQNVKRRVAGAFAAFRSILVAH